MPLLLSRTDAQALLDEWVQSESLRRHCRAVELAVRAYARDADADEEQWGVAGAAARHGLRAPSRPRRRGRGHPRTALRVLEEMDVDPVVVRAIASHADFLGVSRDSDLERTLFACDELCGFLLACAYVRPQGIHGLTPKSVKKKLKAAELRRRGQPRRRRGGAERARRRLR